MMLSNLVREWGWGGGGRGGSHNFGPDLLVDDDVRTLHVRPLVVDREGCGISLHRQPSFCDLQRTHHRAENAPNDCCRPSELLPIARRQVYHPRVLIWSGKNPIKVGCPLAAVWHTHGVEKEGGKGPFQCHKLGFDWTARLCVMFTRVQWFVR